ncbi:hypothetical protein ACFQZ4_04625 [Catellatospora coxensis]|uniref:Uncharacterized protein n=1 Tax=Catellatospora coxensis TaxID=310354 RepID=A0A8J3KSA6_9ACTN|nr:hypothetical protein [Catellatospora coxensis]GIG06230.1 hypothetical protein Cco03nite_29300 [Catellatospora coxensis]
MARSGGAWHKADRTEVRHPPLPVQAADLTGAYSSGGGRPARSLADLQQLLGELRRFYADAARGDEAVGYRYG